MLQVLNFRHGSDWLRWVALARATWPFRYWGGLTRSIAFRSMGEIEAGTEISQERAR